MSVANPLRVLYSFPHQLGAPGIGTTAWHQVNNLVQLGLEVHVACTSVLRPIDGLASVKETLKLGPVRIPHRAFGSIDRAMAWHDVLVSRSLRRTTNKVDLVHGWPSGSLATIRAARSLGIPFALERPHAHTRFVYEINDRISAELGLEVPRSSWAHMKAARLKREETEFDLADRLLCPSDFVFRTFQQEGYEKTLTRHQYGYDPEKFKPENPRSRPDNAPLRVAYVGRCFPLKCLHIALDAWFRSGVSEQGTFIICGRFDPGYREFLASGLAHKSVEVLGFQNDVGTILQQCDVLMHPSAAEGSALIGYEARGAGCVVLASNSSGFPAVHDKNALIHEFGDVDELAHQLAALDRDRSLLNRLRDASISDLDQLTWAAAGRRVAEIYQEMLEKQPKRKD